MKHTFRQSLVAALLICSIASCTKETSIETGTGTGANGNGSGGSGGTNGGSGGTTGSAALQGTWTFTQIHCNTNASVGYTAGGETVQSTTLSDYTSTNEKGSIVFGPSTMQVIDMSYSISTTVKSITYINGEAEPEMDIPWDFDSPVTNGTYNYVQIGSDSLYFSGGGLSAPSSQSSGDAGTGYTFTIANGVLTMKLHDAVRSQTINSGGINAKQTEIVNGTLTFKKS